MLFASYDLNTADLLWLEVFGCPKKLFYAPVDLPRRWLFNWKASPHSYVHPESSRRRNYFSVQNLRREIGGPADWLRGEWVHFWYAGKFLGSRRRRYWKHYATREQGEVTKKTKSLLRIKRKFEYTVGKPHTKRSRLRSKMFFLHM